LSAADRHRFSRRRVTLGAAAKSQQEAEHEAGEEGGGMLKHNLLTPVFGPVTSITLAYRYDRFLGLTPNLTPPGVFTVDSITMQAPERLLALGGTQTGRAGHCFWKFHLKPARRALPRVRSVIVH